MPDIAGKVFSSRVLLGKYSAARRCRVIVRKDIAGQVCRSRIMLCMYAETGLIAQKHNIGGQVGKFAYARYCWTSAHMQDIVGQVTWNQGITGQVCRNRVSLGKCTKAGYCWSGLQKPAITEQVCRSRALLPRCAETGYCWQVCRSRVPLGECASAGYRWDACRSGVLLCKCAEVGYCGLVFRSWVFLGRCAEAGCCCESLQLPGIAGPVCISRLSMVCVQKQDIVGQVC